MSFPAMPRSSRSIRSCFNPIWMSSTCPFLIPSSTSLASRSGCLVTLLNCLDSACVPSSRLYTESRILSNSFISKAEIDPGPSFSSRACVNKSPSFSSADIFSVQNDTSVRPFPFRGADSILTKRVRASSPRPASSPIVVKASSSPGRKNLLTRLTMPLNLIITCPVDYSRDCREERWSRVELVKRAVSQETIGFLQSEQKDYVCDGKVQNCQW